MITLLLISFFLIIFYGVRDIDHSLNHALKEITYN